MYNSSVEFVVKSIQKSSLVNLNGLIYQEYQDFFDDLWLEKLSTDFDKLKFDVLTGHEKLPRRRVDYSEKISKELNIFFKNKKITKCLEDIFTTQLVFSTADIWEDSAGYMLMPHLDNPCYKLGMQIYIGDAPQRGTSLYGSVDPYNKIHEILYERNRGYALVNNDKGWHAVYPAVSKGPRRSVYIRYK